MSRPLLSLVMIVKNESASIREVLETAKPWVDRYTIWDTGSDDGTQDIVREVMADKPGLLHEEPYTPCSFEHSPEINHFIDFAATRNKLLDYDGALVDHSAVFQLMLSGDEYLRNGDKLREHLEAHRDTDADCHFVVVLVDTDNARVPSQRVIRAGSAWRYEYPIHEIPFNRGNPNAKVPLVAEVVIDHIVSDPERRTASLEDHHWPVLRAMLVEDPRSERALMFLAQTHRALFPHMEFHSRVSYAMEALSLYQRLLALPSLNEATRNYAELHYLLDARALGLFMQAIGGSIESFFTRGELYFRAENLAKRDPYRAEAALLRAHCSISVLKREETYKLYREAIEIAQLNYVDDSTPRSTNCHWQAHFYAAMAAMQISKLDPKAEFNGDRYSDLIAHHVSKGVGLYDDGRVSGWEIFRNLVEPPAERKIEKVVVTDTAQTVAA